MKKFVDMMSFTYMKNENKLVNSDFSYDQSQATSDMDVIFFNQQFSEAANQSEFTPNNESIECFLKSIRYFVRFKENLDISITEDGLIDLTWQRSSQKTLIITMMPGTTLAYGAYNDGEKVNGVVTLQEMELTYGNALKLLQLLNDIFSS